MLWKTSLPQPLFFAQTFRQAPGGRVCNMNEDQLVILRVDSSGGAKRAQSAASR